MTPRNPGCGLVFGGLTYSTTEMVCPGKVAGQDTAFSLGSDRHDAPSGPHVQQRRLLQSLLSQRTVVLASVFVCLSD